LCWGVHGQAHSLNLANFVGCWLLCWVESGFTFWK